MFDESFVQAARLQEYSAQERAGDHAPAVHSRPTWVRKGLSRQAVVLVVLIAVAFGSALYMGIRPPEPPRTSRPTQPLRMTVVPLVPPGPVPGAARAENLFDHSPAAQFPVGAAGINLPAAHSTAHFSDSQVVTALSTAKDYLVESSLDPDVLTGGAVRPVRIMVDPQQLDQFDQSFRHPAADGRHGPTGWLVRFDPERTALADPKIRVQGTLRYAEDNPGNLEVISDHTFVYALRRTEGSDRVSLLTVRRELHFRFDRDDLRLGQAELVMSNVQAGPLSCGDESASRLRPLLAGQKARDAGPAGTDPYAAGDATALCGALAGSAQPSPAA